MMFWNVYLVWVPLYVKTNMDHEIDTGVSDFYPKKFAVRSLGLGEPGNTTTHCFFLLSIFGHILSLCKSKKQKNVLCFVFLICSFFVVSVLKLSI